LLRDKTVYFTKLRGDVRRKKCDGGLIPRSIR